MLQIDADDIHYCDLDTVVVVVVCIHLCRDVWLMIEITMLFLYIYWLIHTIDNTENRAHTISILMLVMRGAMIRH